MSFWSELPSHALYCGFLTAGRIGELLRSEMVVVLSYMNELQLLEMLLR